MAQNDVYFTKEELQSGNVEAVQAVEPMIDLINLENAEAYEQSMQPYTRAQRLIFAVEVYAAEVYNGGHEQFFFNSSGVVWRDALEGLKAIGALETAEILERVVRKLKSKIPDDADKRRAMLEKLEEGLLEEEDDAFYAMETDLAELEQAYLCKHAADFVLERQQPQATSSIPSGSYQALFYDSCYYLPAEQIDLSALLEEARQSGEPVFVHAIELMERSDVKPVTYELGVCLAPYFISDYLSKPQTVTVLDAAQAYTVQVELLTQQEYNDRLRALVQGYCPGCRGFGGLTQNDSSLSGHFDEIALNGVCLYRWETRSRPRNFFDELANFASYWNRCGYSDYSADDVLDELKRDLKLSYTSGMIIESDGKRTLMLHVKKPTLILTALTDLLAKVVHEYWDENYTIRLNGRVESDEAAIQTLLEPKKLAALRKECGRYGVSIAELTYDPAHEAAIAAFVNASVEDGLMWKLTEKAGRMFCLFTSPDGVLVRMRYHSPMLEPCGLNVTVCDALKTTAYTISFDMPCRVLDAGAETVIKEQKSKKRLKAEAGKVLSRKQAEDLFAYVESRLYKDGCDHTLRFTRLWLRETMPEEQYKLAMEEIQQMGGYCDCEVLANCYRDYDIGE